MALSQKELEILTMVALGYSDKEIGLKLKIAYGTVRSHIDKLILKLNARNRANAVFIYKQNQKDWLEEYCETYNNSLDGRKLLSDRI